MYLSPVAIFALCGILGGLLTAAGDLLLDLKGPENERLGKLEIIDSMWPEMDIRRFKASIWLAAAGTPLIFLGITAMAHQISLASQSFAAWFWLISVVGAVGSFFIHTIICLFPVIFKTMQEDGHTFSEIERVINAVYYTIRLPFWVQYFTLVVIPSLMIIYALFVGYLGLSMWYGLLTFPFLFGLGLLLAMLKRDWFCDVPFAVMPSLSMCCVGVLALLSCIG